MSVTRQLQADPPTLRTPPAVLWWAGLGALFLAVQLYSYTAWIVTGNAKPTPVGPDEIPMGMQVAIGIIQVLGVVGVIAIVYVFVVRPWRRERRLTADGVFVLGFFTIFWQDPLINYLVPISTYNSGAINFGSWSANVPGWVSPNGNLMAEPILAIGCGYVYIIGGGALLFATLMRRAKARWPRLGVFGVLGVALLVVIVVDIVVEFLFIRLGLWTYAGYPEIGPMLGEGHYYQLPLYEGLLWGVTWVAMASIRYFTDDKGQMLVERGLTRVSASPRLKGLLRWLAVVGGINLAFLIFYIVPINVLGAHAGEWPQDVQQRSYLTDGLCGPGTEYACPGPNVPINRVGGPHLSPEGNWIVPSPAGP